MDSKKFSFVGYWNGLVDDWTVSKYKTGDQPNILVEINIVEIPDNQQTKYNQTKLKRKMKRVSKEIRNLAASSKKWGL